MACTEEGLRKNVQSKNDWHHALLTVFGLLLSVDSLYDIWWNVSRYVARFLYTNPSFFAAIIICRAHHHLLLHHRLLLKNDGPFIVSGYF